MNILEAITSIIQSLAWPITIIIIIYLLKTPFSKLLPNTKKIKYKDLSIEFANINKNILENRYSEEEKNKFQSQQIIQKTDYYKLYANGILVQRYKTKIYPSIENIIVFPIAFPNEVLSIQMIGNTEMEVAKLNNENCTIIFPSLEQEKNVEFILSGI